MKAWLSYLDVLFGTMVVCWLWGGTMLSALMPFDIHVLGHVIHFPLLWYAGTIAGMNAGIGIRYSRRQEDRIGHLSREDIEDLFSWGLIMGLVLGVLSVPLEYSAADEYIILRWAFVTLTFINLLLWLHVLAAETVHRYNRMQEARSAAEAEGSYSSGTGFSVQAQVDALTKEHPEPPGHQRDSSPGFWAGVMTAWLAIIGIESAWMQCKGLEGAARWECAVSIAFGEATTVAAAGSFVVICVAYLALLLWRRFVGSRVQSDGNDTERNSSVK